MRILWVLSLSFFCINAHAQPSLNSRSTVLQKSNEYSAKANASPPPRGMQEIKTGKMLFFFGLPVSLLSGVFLLGSSQPSPIYLASFLASSVAWEIAAPALYFSGTNKEAQYASWKRVYVDRIADRADINEPYIEASKSSAQLRQGRTFAIHGEPIGFSGGIGNESGVIGSYYFTSNQLFELGASMPYLFDRPEGYEHDGIYRNIKKYYAALRLTNFWDNSFYTTQGIGYRSVKMKLYGLADETTADGGGAKKIFYEHERQDIGVDIAIGNRWQWRRASFGVDWLGLYIPIRKFRDRDSPYFDRLLSAELSRAASASNDAVNKVLGNRVALSGMRINWGVSF